MIKGGGASLALLFLTLFAALVLLATLCGASDYPPFIMNPDEFPNITISSINCNSLNMSNIGSMNHKLKLYGITKLRTDIIFLSDLRLNNNQNISCIPLVRSTFRTNPYGGYELVYNLTMNKRGVGILLKISTCFRICEKWRDPAENSLLLKLQIEGKPFTFIVGCIYGPNNHEPVFFDYLRNNIPRNMPVILGGDWNCTPNNSPPPPEKTLMFLIWFLYQTKGTPII